MATCPNLLLDNIPQIRSIPSRHGTNETRKLWGKINVPLTCGDTRNIDSPFHIQPHLAKKLSYPWDLHLDRQFIGGPVGCPLCPIQPHVILRELVLWPGLRAFNNKRASNDRVAIDSGYRVMNTFKNLRAAIYGMIFWCSGCRAVIC